MRREAAGRGRRHEQAQWRRRGPPVRVQDLQPPVPDVPGSRRPPDEPHEAEGAWRRMQPGAEDEAEASRVPRVRLGVSDGPGSRRPHAAA
ncbi:hypothetical protein MUK42_14830 [Musa troglodytarum]|uniref:Uncharacterized protein n=1 Tax=Musa troglodytarum TaxID=320322 RepID=A0A9E7LDY3_9LILI|nr:hypothetical protein MUK42_14830 [Musa troglodytarum]